MDEPVRVAADRTQLSAKWQERFDFFDAYGLPGMWKNGAVYRQGLRALPFLRRIRVSFNFFGFFLIWFYLIALGLWRKAVVWGLVYMAFGLISQGVLPESSFWEGFFLGLGVLTAMRVNGYYYELKVKGEETWAL